VPLIVVREDDSSTRVLVAAVLRKEGYDVLAAEDGAQGLALVREHQPNLIISDVQMPVLDGFGMLQAVRADQATATIPIILLTSLQDRANMRHGMTTGADDYLTKPFMPQELRDAVNAQLNKLVRAEAVQAQVVDRAVAQALAQQQEKITALYEKRMAKELSEQWPEASQVDTNERYSSATVLYADMRDYTKWTQRLAPNELGVVVTQFYSSVGDTVHLFGARHMQFVGDGMLCVFVDSADTHSVNHAFRATKAALGLQDGCKRLDSFVAQKFGDRGLPPFRLNVMMHSGPVMFTRLDGMFAAGAQSTPVGEPVSTALRFFSHVDSPDWSIAATVQTNILLRSAARIGRRAMVHVQGRQGALDMVELIGLAS
jgi:DNA-binding response OmpR family regulator